MSDDIDIDIDRIEIIGPDGREYVAYFERGISWSVQDDGRTLKLFVGRRREATP